MLISFVQNGASIGVSGYTSGVPAGVYVTSSAFTMLNATILLTGADAEPVPEAQSTCAAASGQRPAGDARATAAQNHESGNTGRKSGNSCFAICH